MPAIFQANHFLSELDPAKLSQCRPFLRSCLHIANRTLRRSGPIAGKILLAC